MALGYPGGMRHSGLRHALEQAAQLRRIEWGFDFNIVVEVAVDIATAPRLGTYCRYQPRIGRLCACAPRLDALGPVPQRPIAITARIELLVAMQADVHKVSGDVFAGRPVAGAVRYDERDAVTAQ